MSWDIERTDEFTGWWDRLSEDAQIAIAAVVGVLAEKGPSLGRPYADTLEGSEIPNLKELRIQHGGEPYRVLYVFDPRQTAILLLGGRKGSKRWYDKIIKQVEAIYAAYLEELKKEGFI